MELADLFSIQDHLPRELEMEKEIFTSIENAGEIKVPEYLSDKIDDAIRAQRPLKRSLKWTAFRRERTVIIAFQQFTYSDYMGRIIHIASKIISVNHYFPDLASAS